MRVVTIGSNPQCDIVLYSDGIEPVHCQIIQDDNANYRIVAFGRTRINENDVKGEVSLNFDDILTLGNIGDCWQRYVCNRRSECDVEDYYCDAIYVAIYEHCRDCFSHNYSRFIPKVTRMQEIEQIKQYIAKL